MGVDYYQLLGVRSDAKDDDLKSAYRRLARELHPDSTGGDSTAEAKFKEVTKAYEVLRDPQRRARYDHYGPEGVDGQGGGGGFDPFGGGLGDLFDAFFGGAAGAARGSKPGPMRGPDAEVVLDLTFRDAVFGVQHELTVDGMVACETCSATGALPGTTAIRCSECDGSGELRRVRSSILGQVVTAVPCTRCQGTGEYTPSPCPDCRGEGRRPAQRTLAVNVPAGVDHGSTLRLTGQGPVGPRGGPPGDLYVHLAVHADERMARNGSDLRADLHVAMTQAAIGAVIEFESLDGTEKVTVAPGTQAGTVMRLKGKGVPHIRGRGRGDLLIRILVDTPTDVPAEQQDLLRQLAALRGEMVADAKAPSRRSRRVPTAT